MLAVGVKAYWGASYVNMVKGSKGMVGTLTASAPVLSLCHRLIHASR